MFFFRTPHKCSVSRGSLRWATKCFCTSARTTSTFLPYQTMILSNAARNLKLVDNVDNIENVDNVDNIENVDNVEVGN